MNLPLLVRTVGLTVTIVIDAVVADLCFTTGITAATAAAGRVFAAVLLVGAIDLVVTIIVDAIVTDFRPATALTD